MTKKLSITPENSKGIVVDYSTEEEAQFQTDISASANAESMLDIIEAKETLKASAKAKLIAGEALTEEEANTIVL